MGCSGLGKVSRIRSGDVVESRLTQKRSMVTILREHGYTIREPSAGSGDDDNAEQVSWSDGERDIFISVESVAEADLFVHRQDTVTGAGPHAAPSSAPSTERAVAVEASNVEADALARFHLLTSLMEQNRGEDGRVSAVDLEQSLLSQDADAFVKEGVDQLKQYLMKARENGIPIKFDGDRSGLHQVWFKGHKDLVSAAPLHLYSVYYAYDTNSSSRSLVHWLVTATTEEPAADHSILPLVRDMERTGIGVDVRTSSSSSSSSNSNSMAVVVRDTWHLATLFEIATCPIATAHRLSVLLTLTFYSTSCTPWEPILVKAPMPIW
jgi:hypothetical protein